MPESYDGFEQFYDAVVEGDMDTVKARVADDSALVTTTDKYGFTALHGVASEEHMDIARFLIENGADVNAGNDQGIRPLHLAAYPKMVDLLLDRGAEINVRANDGSTPLHVLAAEPDTEDVLERLLKRGADPTLRDNRGATPEDIAALREDEEKLEIFAAFASAPDEQVEQTCQNSAVWLCMWIVRRGIFCRVEEFGERPERPERVRPLRLHGQYGA